MSKACSICGALFESKQFKTCDKCRARTRDWKKANHKKNSEYNRKYRIINKVRLVEYAHKYYMINREQICKKAQEYKKLNHDEILKRGLIYREANRERENKRSCLWLKVNREKCRVQEHTRRARINGSSGSYSLQEEMELFTWQEGKCHYCGNFLYLSYPQKYHIYHKTPLSRGGSNLIDNIALSCKFCNIRKGTKTELEFFKFLVKNEEKNE